MARYNYSISNEVFEQFPGYMRGVVLAKGVVNRPSPGDLLELLRGAEEEARGKLNAEKLIEDPHIQPWREAFRAFGAKPGDHRSSIEALARRVLRGDALPSINALVDIGNIISLRHLLPAGSHAIDRLTQDIALRVAKGDESFIPYGEEMVEHPLRGEIIFAEGNIVLTRRWVWRQSTHTLTQLETRAVEFNVDALPPVALETIDAACMEICGLVEAYCGGRIRYEVLKKDHPQMSLQV